MWLALTAIIGLQVAYFIGWYAGRRLARYVNEKKGAAS